MSERSEIYNDLAPCGVFCGACPSYEKTCIGCASEKRDQKRSSKWGCKIRKCCYEEKELNYCIHCDRFPCTILNKKLVDSHPGDPRFRYRHEIPEIFPLMKELSIDTFYNFYKKRWECASCGGTIRFYHYRCDSCGKDYTPTYI